MPEGWYLYQDGKQSGPYTWEELWSLAQAGRIGPGDVVWTKGMSDWRPAVEIPGLPQGSSQAEPSSARPLMTAAYAADPPPQSRSSLEP